MLQSSHTFSYVVCVVSEIGVLVLFGWRLGKVPVVGDVGLGITSSCYMMSIFFSFFALFTNHLYMNISIIMIIDTANFFNSCCWIIVGRSMHWLYISTHVWFIACYSPVFRSSWISCTQVHRIRSSDAIGNMKTMQHIYICCMQKVTSNYYKILTLPCTRHFLTEERFDTYILRHFDACAWPNRFVRIRRHNFEQFMSRFVMKFCIAHDDLKVSLQNIYVKSSWDRWWLSLIFVLFTPKMPKLERYVIL